VAINAALAAARQGGTLPVPPRLRNAPTALAKELGHGDGYRYPHDHGGWVPEHYLPDALAGTTFYSPTEEAGYERHLAERLRDQRARRGPPPGRGGAKPGGD
jgi:putative ATPase